MGDNKSISKVTTPVFRVSFPNVFEPQSFDGGDPKYGLTMLFDSDADLSALREAAKRAAREKWGEGKIPQGLRSPFRDGAEKPDLDGYEGKIFVRCTSKQKPGLVDLAVKPIIDPSEFYAGCYAIATLNAYAYDTKGNKGIAFGLLNIQKQGDGTPFSGRSRPEDDFKPVASAASGSGAVDDLF
jgi:hypothetical protein